MPEPFISAEQRPDVSIDLDKNICAYSLRELRDAVGREFPGGPGDLKVAPDTSMKNANKDSSDKLSGDIKTANDFKVSSDKQHGDNARSGPPDSAVLELLSRLLDARQGK